MSVSSSVSDVVPNKPLERLVTGQHLLETVDSGKVSYCGNKRHAKRSERVEAVAYCIDCEKFFCQKCHEGHEVLEDTFEGHRVRMLGAAGNHDNKEGVSVAFMKDRVFSNCRYHDGQLCQYYCEECDVVVCQVCVVEGHSAHKPKYLKTYNIPFSLNAVKVSKRAQLDWESKCQDQIANLQERLREIEQAEEFAMESVEEVFKSLREALDQRRIVVKQEIALASFAPKISLCSSVEKLTLCLAILHHNINVLQFFDEFGSAEDILSLRKTADARADYTHSQCVQCITPPAQSDVLKVQFGQSEQSLHEMISKLGKVDRGLDPSECIVTPNLSGIVHKMADYDLDLQVHIENATDVDYLGEHLCAFLRSPLTSSPPIRGSVKADKGICCVKFSRFYVGKCELDVMLNGLHVTGSPFVFSLAVIPRQESLGVPRGVLPLPEYRSSGRVAGGFARLAVSPKGDVYIADNIRNTIHQLDRHMNYIGEVQQCQGRIGRPRSVAVDAKGQLLVSHSHVVDLFKLDGSVTSVGKGLLQHPWDVAINRNGEIFVSDTGNHRIVVFSPDGSEVLREFGCKGANPGQFNLPSGLAFLPSGNVVVGDTENNRIQIFTQMGVFVRVFTVKEVFCPRQLFTTIEGFVFCTSSANHSVVVFDPSGQCLASFGSHGTRLGQLREPKGLAVAFDGRILVSEGEGYRVQIF